MSSYGHGKSHANKQTVQALVMYSFGDFWICENFLSECASTTHLGLLYKLAIAISDDWLTTSAFKSTKPSEYWISY